MDWHGLIYNQTIIDYGPVCFIAMASHGQSWSNMFSIHGRIC